MHPDLCGALNRITCSSWFNLFFLHAVESSVEGKCHTFRFVTDVCIVLTGDTVSHMLPGGDDDSLVDDGSSSRCGAKQ